MELTLGYIIPRQTSVVYIGGTECDGGINDCLR